MIIEWTRNLPVTRLKYSVEVKSKKVLGYVLPLIEIVDETKNIKDGENGDCFNNNAKAYLYNLLISKTTGQSNSNAMQLKKITQEYIYRYNQFINQYESWKNSKY